MIIGARVPETVQLAMDDASIRPGSRHAGGRRELRVLYLFAGARRKSGLGGSLLKACAGTAVRIKLEEKDILQGGQEHNMLRTDLRKAVMERVKNGAFDLVVASPPCSTFS